MNISPRSAAAMAILLFQVNPTNGSMMLTHTTIVDQIPSALAPFGGRLLCGVGSVLRLYDIGRRQLLRKCETRIPTFITSIATQGWRVFVGDSAQSLLMFNYRSVDNRFMLIADDVHPHPVTALLPLDYETVAVADRMGNFVVLRLPASVTEDLENDTTAGAVGAKRDHLFGAPFKLERLVDFYVGDTIMSLNKCSLSVGSREVILYTTISGSYGIFLPFTQREDALLMQNMEMRLRQEPPATLVGRDHQIFHSYYASIKSVIDGDLCETFIILSGDRKHFISQSLEKSPVEILNKLEDLKISAGV